MLGVVIPGKPNFAEDVARGVLASWEVWCEKPSCSGNCPFESANKVSAQRTGRTSHLVKVTRGNILRLGWSRQGTLR